MEYDWERKITQDTLRKMAALLPKGFALVAVAVEKVDAVEAALIVNHDNPDTDITAADVWKDIYGDAERIYERAVEDMRAVFEAVRAKRDANRLM